MFFPFVERFGCCLSPPSDTDIGLRAALRPVCQEGFPRAGEGRRHSQLDKVGPLVRRHLQVKLFVDRSLSFLLGGSGLSVGSVPQAVEPFYKRRGKILQSKCINTRHSVPHCFRLLKIGTYYSEKLSFSGDFLSFETKCC